MAKCPKYTLLLPKKKVQTLVESLLKGTPVTYACDKALIPPFYISRWRKELEDYIEQKVSEADAIGEEPDLSFIEPPLDDNGELIWEKLNTLSLSVVIKNARACYLEQLNDLLKDSVKDTDQWQKYAWLLERCFKDIYSREEQNNEKVKTVEAIKVVYVDENSDNERLEKLDREVRENINANS